MRRYFVESEETCPDCQGTGVVQHPAWAVYWQEHPLGVYPTSREDEQWFREQGYDYPPDEEVPCSECDGAGVIRQRVPLEDALAYLGLEVKHGRDSN